MDYDAHVEEPAAKRRRLTQFGSGDTTDYYRAADVPGWDPVPRMNQYGTVTNLSNGDESSRRIMINSMDSTLANSSLFNGESMPTVPDTWNTTVFGSARAMTQVTAHIQVRPLRQSVNGPELQVNFRYGDPVFVWARTDDRQLLESAHVHYPNLQTAVNYEQLRAFEASYMQYSVDTPAIVGVRTYRDTGPKEAKLVDELGNDIEGLGTRPGVFERWRFVGVCVAVDPVKDTFPMITVCTQGPAKMLNVFSKLLRVGTDLFFREVHVVNSATTNDWNERQANTIKTLMAWPPHAAVSRYEKLTVNAGLMAASHMLTATNVPGEVGNRHYGPYRIIEPIGVSSNKSSYTGLNWPTNNLWTGLGFKANVFVLDRMCVVGRVVDVEPTGHGEPSLRGGWSEGTSVYNGAASNIEGLTEVFHGYITVNLQSACGLMIEEAVATLASQGYSANLDLL